MEKALFSWSGGKDSAFAFYELSSNENIEIAGLLTTFREGGTIPMHEVGKELIECQAEKLGFPLIPVYLPEKADNGVYERRLAGKLNEFKRKGIEKVVHGDIFLEDVRQYRDEQLNQIGMEGFYPLWGKRTDVLADQFVGAGFRAIVTCIDTNVLSRNLIGREYNHEFLKELPKGIDPCGENGEFHTFVFDGPIFSDPIGFEEGDTATSWNGRFVHLALE